MGFLQCLYSTSKFICHVHNASLFRTMICLKIANPLWYWDNGTVCLYLKIPEYTCNLISVFSLGMVLLTLTPLLYEIGEWYKNNDFIFMNMSPTFCTCLGLHISASRFTNLFFLCGWMMYIASNSSSLYRCNKRHHSSRRRKSSVSNLWLPVSLLE